VVEAAAEWFLLSRCSLLAMSQGSEYARTASLRGSGTSLEVTPLVGNLLAGGALDLRHSSSKAAGKETTCVEGRKLGAPAPAAAAAAAAAASLFLKRCVGS
jgi:hypothetical protein